MSSTPSSIVKDRSNLTETLTPQKRKRSFNNDQCDYEEKKRNRFGSRNQHDNDTHDDSKIWQHDKEINHEKTLNRKREPNVDVPEAHEKENSSLLCHRWEKANKSELLSQFQVSESPQLFDLSRRCIPMSAFLNDLPISIHKLILQQTQRSLWYKLQSHHKPFLQTSDQDSISRDSAMIIEEIGRQEVGLQISSQIGCVPDFSASNILKMYTETIQYPSPSAGDKLSEETAKKAEQHIRAKPHRSSDRTSTSLLKQHNHSSNRSISKSSSTIITQRLNRRPQSLIDDIIHLQQRPIILVTTQLSDIINDTNVMEFLTNGRFFDTSKPPPEGVLPSLSCPAVGRPNVIRVIRGKHVKFRLVQCTKAKRLTQNEWFAVVAVILSGPEWQLAGWPFNKIEQVFRSLKGFHFAYSDAVIPSTILKWNGQVMRISRSQRHYDAPVQNEFWRAIESFILLPRENIIDMSQSLIPQHN